MLLGRFAFMSATAGVSPSRSNDSTFLQPHRVVKGSSTRSSTSSRLGIACQRRVAIAAAAAVVVYVAAAMAFAAAAAATSASAAALGIFRIPPSIRR